ncbi:MAG: hypothetical protein F4Y39_16970 [Gemmatimonadetes bacterium]|nr:hypothetical protein [Gemmatimonadota bacterium]MYF75033.1 hypothetical protein [Gemmatimonadota bacterium]MYK52685.1 hypothetical protein [Gemmatimonadota bacterium]
MIKLNLRRTWYEISEYLNSNDPNPLRIAELVNRVPPCCWTFEFTFEGTKRTNVWIDCDSTIADDDARLLINGSLEEVFFTDTLYLRQAGRYLAEDTSKLLQEPPSSNLITLRNLDRNADYLLALKGFWQSNSTPPEIQQNPDIRSYFLENTWLGSPDFADSDYYIRWIVFGTEELIRPENRYETKLGFADNFTTQANLYNTNGDHIGQASFQTSPSLEDDEIYNTFGPLVPKPKNWLNRSRGDPRWIIEIGSQTLKQAVVQGKPTTKHINELVESVEKAKVSVIDSDCFQNYKQDIRRKQLIIAANRLKERQKRAQTGNKVIFKDRPVMLVPSNENEVLVLLCKLEALHALPFHEFFLWEYTSRAGIDAIASYQIKETDVQYMFKAIEVEYHFENFFDHGHPHNQVDLVICWDFRDGEVPLELRQHSEYLFEYRNHESFFILVLSHIPNLQVERS